MAKARQKIKEAVVLDWRDEHTDTITFDREVLNGRKGPSVPVLSNRRWLGWVRSTLRAFRYFQGVVHLYSKVAHG